MKNAAEILETMEFAPSQEISQAPEKSSDEGRKRRWLEKWIRLRQTHLNPQLLSLENALWTFCRDYAKQPSRGRRLLLFGNNGCGKSHSAKAVYRWAARMAIELPLRLDDEGARLSTAQFVHWPSAIKRMRGGDWDISFELARYDLLILDDIGAEHDPSGFAKSELYMLMEKRETRWTMMTTNYGPDQWDDRFERRIASRFLRNCDVIDLSNVADWGTVE